MNLSFQEYLPSVMQFLTGKLIFRNKFENRFSKLITGFWFSNQKPDFLFLINIPSLKPTQGIIYSVYTLYISNGDFQLIALLRRLSDVL